MGRIRNNPKAKELISNSSYLVTNYDFKFNNANPIELEIGSGKGDFIIANALKSPHINFIGLEKDATIVYKIIRKLNNLKDKLTNLLIINDSAINLLKYFKPKSISKIYLNFSDPWPKKRHAKRRLTDISLLTLYDEVLINNGVIELKTDNEILFNYTIESVEKYKKFKVIYKTINLYSDTKQLLTNIQTEYEKRFISLNKNIFKIIIKK